MEKRPPLTDADKLVMAQRITAIIREIMGPKCPELSSNTNLTNDLHCTREDLIEMCMALEEEYGLFFVSSLEENLPSPWRNIQDDEMAFSRSWQTIQGVCDYIFRVWELPDPLPTSSSGGMWDNGWGPD